MGIVIKNRYIHGFIWGTSLFFFTACSHNNHSTLHPTQKTPSKTIVAKGNIPLLSSFKHTDKALSNASAFYPLTDPIDAFAARLFLIDQATTSLDVQYYIYHDDKIGNVFSAHLIEAAQRGVKSTYTS